jgi:peptidoglycan/LPS O-acetylase OafA/YrhL
VAYASYRFIEEPTRKAASRSFGRWVDRLTAVEGAAAWPLPARLARLDGRKI